MIDLQNEKTLSLADAARLLPTGRRGRPVNISTIWRWIHDGVRTPTGETIRLEAVKIGSRWITSAEALDRFAVAQTPRLEPNPVFPRSLAARRRAAEHAALALEAKGI